MSGVVEFASDTASVWSLYPTLTGRLAFDVGANGGMVANMLAERFGTVIAVEPAIESYGPLVAGAAPNVRALQVAVSAQAGEIQLRETSLTDYLGELFTDDTLPWGEHVGYRTLPAVTLDDLTDEYGQPDFLKVDTEGHEVEVLRGGTRTLAAGTRFIIEVHSGPKGEECKALLDAAGLGYEIHLHNRYREDSPHKYNHYWLVNV